MAANVNDKFTKSAIRKSLQIGSGGVPDDSTGTIPLSSSTGLPTDTAVFASIRRKDADGNYTLDKWEVVKGVVSGTNLVNCIRGVEGTAQDHPAGGLVEILLVSSQWDDLIDGLLTEHNQDGTHNLTGYAKYGETNTWTANQTFNSGTLRTTRPRVTTSIDDSNGNEAIKITATSSAVNEVTMTNAATGNTPQIAATGDDTNIHLDLRGKGNGLVKTEVLRQDDTTNAYKPNTVILTGVGKITGGGTQEATEAITFGITFSEVPIINVNYAGYKSTGSFSYTGTSHTGGNRIQVHHHGAVTTGFTLVMTRDDLNLDTGTDFYYTWVAIGQLN